MKRSMSNYRLGWAAMMIVSLAAIASVTLPAQTEYELAASTTATRVFKPSLTPTRRATRTPTPATPPKSTLCPADKVPTGVPEFDEPVAHETNDGLLYVSTGTFVNDLKQEFIITVTGRLPDAVLVYTKELRVCFEAVALVTGGQGRGETKPVEGAGESILKNAQTENLIVEVALEPKQALEMKRGYALWYVIDPAIGKNVTHCYRKSAQATSVSARIWMQTFSGGTPGGQGKVQGSLLKNATPAAAVTVVPPNSPNLPTPAAGYSWYALKVTGLQLSNRYRVSGSWSYSFLATPPPTLAPGVNCK